MLIGTIATTTLVNVHGHHHVEVSHFCILHRIMSWPLKMIIYTTSSGAYHHKSHTSALGQNLLDTCVALHAYKTLP